MNNVIKANISALAMVITIMASGSLYGQPQDLMEEVTTQLSALGFNLPITLSEDQMLRIMEEANSAHDDATKKAAIQEIIDE